ncbi:MAG: hypothetical protein WB626_08410 [Bacteroidota bacterium]
MLLTVMTLALFIGLVISTTELLTSNTVSAQQNEFIVTSISLAQSVIDEAKTKAFDNKTRVTGVTVPDSLTAPGSLGRDGSGEAVPAVDTLTSQGYRSALVFNDVDDYKGYQRRVATRRAGNYNITATVAYGSSARPDSTVSVRTFCKLMRVTVTSPHTASPVTLQYPFIY